MLLRRPRVAPAPLWAPSRYLHEEGGGGDLVLLVASLQERDEQVEDAAQLLAGVVHHGPGGEGSSALRHSSPKGTCCMGACPALKTLSKPQSPVFPHPQGFPPEQDLRGHLITLLHFTGGKTDMQSGKVTCPRPQKMSKKDRLTTPECAGPLQEEKTGRKECEDPVTGHQAASQTLSSPYCI